LAGDLDGALTHLTRAQKKTTHFLILRAVIAARKGNKDGIVNNLKTAIQKDPSFKAMATTDVEFLKYRDDADFKAAIQ